MIRGSCLCQRITFEITQEPEELCNCHCSMCRKAHGAAFATFVRVRTSGFRFLTGDNHLVRYRSSPPVERSFCDTCGTPLLFLHDALADTAWLVAGTLDDDPGIRPSSHIFVASKAPWHDITDGITQYRDYPL